MLSCRKTNFGQNFSVVTFLQLRLGILFDPKSVMCRQIITGKDKDGFDRTKFVKKGFAPERH